MLTKLEGGGGLALVTGPLKINFVVASPSQYIFHAIKCLITYNLQYNMGQDFLDICYTNKCLICHFASENIFYRNMHD